MDPDTCRRARLARDARFDGKLFIAVKTTGIYCRPICPTPPPKESNVLYFNSVIEAANQGYRPCLRCRPDSAPASCAWRGTDATLERALRLLDEGALIDGSIIDLSARLGIGSPSSGLSLFLSYRPPYDWDALRDFLRARLIPELEWCDTSHYGRTFHWLVVDGDDRHGQFTAHHRPERCGFDVSLELDRPGPLLPIVSNIRRVLDLDADIAHIDAQLALLPGLAGRLRPGLRLPGIWDPFEAGVRAILGQQVSVTAARGLVTRLVHQVGPLLGNRRHFPSASDLAEARLDFLKMPASRRDAIKRFAEFYAVEDTAPDPDQWLALKGIGPWTVSYARMRGLSDSDVWLGTDLGVQRTLEREGLTLDPQAASPWQSYLTLQLWCLT